MKVYFKNNLLAFEIRFVLFCKAIIFTAVIQKSCTNRMPGYLAVNWSVIIAHIFKKAVRLWLFYHTESYLF